MKKLIVAAVMLLASVAMSFAANNYIQEGKVLALTFSSTSPTNGDPVVKSASATTGGIVGVAIHGGTGTADETVQVQTEGVFDVPVQAITNAIAIGDAIYTSVTNANVGVASLTNVSSSNLLYGHSLEALVVASNTQTIKVLLSHP